MGKLTVTPQLRQWIVDRTVERRTPESMLKAMIDVGWKKEMAMEAIEATLREYPGDEAKRTQQAPVFSIPDADLTDSPMYLDAGDRRVAVLSALKHPRAILLGNFLSDDECIALIELARPRMARSTTLNMQTGGKITDKVRTSNGMFFRRGENELVRRIEARVAKLFHWPEENGEGVQVLQYCPGAEYKAHYDYFDPAAPGSAAILARGGQRIGTVVMYLNEPEKGGGTTFPDAGLEVYPKRGNALFFSYDKPHPSSGSLHAGAPVVAGEKWIATKWLRERKFS